GHDDYADAVTAACVDLKRTPATPIGTGLQQMAPDDGEVIEDPDAEGDDRGEVELHPQLVAEIGEPTRHDRVHQQAGDEDLVLEIAVEPGFDRAQYRIKRGEDHHRGVARIARRDLDRRVEPEDDAEDAEDEDGPHQPERFARAAGGQPHLRPRICTAGAPGFSRLMYWIGAEVRSIRPLSARKAASFPSRLARSLR